MCASVIGNNTEKALIVLFLTHTIVYQNMLDLSQTNISILILTYYI